MSPKSYGGGQGDAVLGTDAGKTGELIPIIMGNVRSLPNKMDELAALTRYQQEFRRCSMLLFTETWLSAQHTDASVQLDGFSLIRADRTESSGKREGGGLAVFVNDRWCNSRHITIKVQHCCRDIELLAVSVRPYYLPREFSHAIVVAVYIPPSANADAACDVISTTVHRLQTQREEDYSQTVRDHGRRPSPPPTHTHCTEELCQ